MRKAYKVAQLITKKNPDQTMDAPHVLEETASAQSTARPTTRKPAGPSVKAHRTRQTHTRLTIGSS